MREDLGSAFKDSWSGGNLESEEEEEWWVNTVRTGEKE
jgi:hypothetical protein